MNTKLYIHEAIEYIEMNLYNDINLDELCDYSGYSKYHFSRLFNSIVGMTIPEYINSRRLSEGALLLRRTSKKVIDIAFKCGFNSDKYFISKFKEKFNITPHEYRKGNDFIIITTKLVLKGDTKMKYYTAEQLVTYLVKKCSSKQELYEEVANIENCVIKNISNSDVELIVVLYSNSDNTHSLYQVEFNMLNGIFIEKLITSNKLMEDVRIDNLSLVEGVVEVDFIDKSNNISHAKIIDRKLDKVQFNVNIYDIKEGV